ncbi:MAG: amidase [Herpetosiphonaceae bacterium]|nr:amidase [Herpetosiphonaceae bacterium]
MTDQPPVQPLTPDNSSTPPIDYSTWLPLDTEPDETDPQPDSLGEFSYVGKGVTPEEFGTYLQSYDFGTIPPDYIILHHTAVPTLATWTAGESGLSDDQVKQKRLVALHGLMVYYRDTLKWNAGPHLFIDDRYIWLFSEMNEPGIHAMWGNSHHNGGRLHYSIGIEVVGDYTQQQWSPAVAHMVNAAVNALRQRLQTFDLRYMYADPASKPGLVFVNKSPRCPHPERLSWGGISSHRDYNKPACPGNAISEAFYMGVLNGGGQVTGQQAAGATRTVGSGGLHVRANPGADQAVVAVLPHGASVTLLNESQVVDGSTWVKVQAGSTVGWVNQRFLE